MRRPPVHRNWLPDCPRLSDMSHSRIGPERVANETIQRTLRDRSHPTTVRKDDVTDATCRGEFRASEGCRDVVSSRLVEVVVTRSRSSPEETECDIVRVGATVFARRASRCPFDRGADVIPAHNQKSGNIRLLITGARQPEARPRQERKVVDPCVQIFRATICAIVTGWVSTPMMLVDKLEASRHPISNIHSGHDRSASLFRPA